MQHAQHLDLIQVHAINHDKRSPGNYQFTRTPEAPGATQIGMVLEIFHRLLYPPTHFRGGRWIIFSDVVTGVVKVSQGTGGPFKLHAGPTI